MTGSTGDTRQARKRIGRLRREAAPKADASPPLSLQPSPNRRRQRAAPQDPLGPRASRVEFLGASQKCDRRSPGALLARGGSATAAGDAGRRGASPAAVATMNTVTRAGRGWRSPAPPGEASMTENFSILLDLLLNQAVDVIAMKGNRPLAVNDLGSIRSRQNQNIMTGIVG